MAKVLLEAKNLVKEFPVDKRRGLAVHAVSNINLKLYEGETLALVGESGCGKSTLGRTLIRLLQPTSGNVYLEGRDITHMKEGEFSHYRRMMQMVFQDPYASLNPRMTVHDIIAEPLKTYMLCQNKQELDERILDLMGEVGVQKDFVNRYSHQFSGGQRQRIGIARAIALKPKLIVCDEPVSALDVSVQSQVLNLLKDLQKKTGVTYLFISHDLSVVNYIADRVCVMFLGKVCEIAEKNDLYQKPLHPYTKFLIDAIPQADPHTREEGKRLLTGEIPSPVNPPSGCRFHTRCPYATDKCKEEEPVMRQIEGHEVACHYAGEIGYV